jgi:hypothetical protein
MQIKVPVLLLMLVILLVLGGAFYWYEYRPSAIRQECHKYAVDKAQEDSGDHGRFYDEDYDFRFKYCLQKNGKK